MKHILTCLYLIFAFSSFAYAETVLDGRPQVGNIWDVNGDGIADYTLIHNLTADTTPTTDDLVMVENDPSGSPVMRKVTLGNLSKGLTGIDEAYGSGWNGDTGLPEKDDIYDYLHQMDTDDDGSLIDEVALTGAFETIWTGKNSTTLGTGSNDTLTVNGNTSGTDLIMLYTGSTGILDFNVPVTASSFTADASTTPSVVFSDSDRPGTDKIAAQILATHVSGAEGAEYSTLSGWADTLGTMTKYWEIDATNGYVNFALGAMVPLDQYMQFNAATERIGSDDAGYIDIDYATGLRLNGTAITSVLQPYDADLTTWAGITPGSNVGTFLATPSSANFAAAITDETGTDAVVLANSPTFTDDITLGAADTTKGSIILHGDNADAGPTVTLYNSANEDGTEDYWVMEPQGTNFWFGSVSDTDQFIFSNAGNFTASGNVAGATYGSDASISNAEFLYINSLSSNAQDQLDGKEWTAPATRDADATPEVAHRGTYYITNTGALTVTDFVDSDGDHTEFNNQTVIRVWLEDADITIDFSENANIEGNGGVDFTASATQLTELDFSFDGTRWKCANLNTPMSTPTNIAISSIALAGTIEGLVSAHSLTTAEGQHDTGENAATLVDSGESWATDEYIGMTLYNVTDGSSCTVTDNDGTSMTCTLTGGTDNDWDTTDVWAVAPGPNQSGGWWYISGATTILHPATPGYIAGYFAAAAQVIKIDPQSASMTINFSDDGVYTDPGAGDEIDGDGTQGDYIVIHNVSATEAYSTGVNGSFADGGAS